MKLINLAAATVFTLSSLSANALLIEGGSNYNIPTSNLFKFNNSITEIEYNVGGNVKADFDGHIDLKFTYLGAEASKYNTFTVGGNTLGNEFNSAGDSFVYGFDLMNGDLFDFIFSTEVAVMPNSVANGANGEDITKPSFAILSLAKFKNSPYDALLLLDDTGGGNDDNHDDLVIGVNVVGVPESSTFVLMMMGLVGLFAARRLKA
jgi:hypothetical protein